MRCDLERAMRRADPRDLAYELRLAGEPERAFALLRALSSEAERRIAADQPNSDSVNVVQVRAEESTELPSAPIEPPSFGGTEVHLVSNSEKQRNRATGQRRAPRIHVPLSTVVDA